jgi:hypothetical protein
MWMRLSAVVAAAMFWLIGPSPSAAQVARVTNPYSEGLLRLSPDARASRLAERIGLGCIGSNAFLMGVTQTGPAAGYAYWSIECAGGNSYAIQIAPDGRAVVIDCRTLNAEGGGRECFRKF